MKTDKILNNPTNLYNMVQILSILCTPEEKDVSTGNVHRESALTFTLITYRRKVRQSQTIKI